jgi:2-phosphosulfolactate phosphatase
VITGSFVNAEAIVKYIKSLDPEFVYLVAMGYRATQTADEDILCARLIEDRLKGKADTRAKEIKDLQYSSGNRFFLKSNLEFSPPTDFFLCTMTDRFPFVLKALRREDGNVLLIKTDV